jgi:hypothetical protein
MKISNYKSFIKSINEAVESKRVEVVISDDGYPANFEDIDRTMRAYLPSSTVVDGDIK